MHGWSDNPEFVAALVHGRRSHMIEGGRLRRLSQATTLEAVGQEVWGPGAPRQAEECQRRLVVELARETVSLGDQLGGAAGALLHWMAAWHELQDLKVVLRGRAKGVPMESLRPALTRLATRPGLDWAALGGAASVAEVVRLSCERRLRRPLLRALGEAPEAGRGFLGETVLDRMHHDGLLSRVADLAPEDRAWVAAVVCQEADTFHLMLVARGRHLWGLRTETLLPLHLAGTRIPRARFAAMLAEPDLRAAASLAVGRALDALPADGVQTDRRSVADTASVLERFASKRLHRLANRAFRGSHMRAATVVAYAVLRQLENANLGAACEGIRLGASLGDVQRHLVPAPSEAAHV